MDVGIDRKRPTCQKLCIAKLNSDILCSRQKLFLTSWLHRHGQHSYISSFSVTNENDADASKT